MQTSIHHHRIHGKVGLTHLKKKTIKKRNRNIILSPCGNWLYHLGRKEREDTTNSMRSRSFWRQVSISLCYQHPPNSAYDLNPYSLCQQGLIIFLPCKVSLSSSPKPWIYFEKRPPGQSTIDLVL